MTEWIINVDRRVANKVVKIHNKILNKIMIAFTYSGVAAIIWFVTLAIPFLFIKSYRDVGLCMIIALGVNYLLSEVLLKHLVRRKRPSTFVDDDKMLINKPKDPSFPSGHASSSFAATAVVFLLCPWYIFVPAFIVASIIGFSRIYLQVHYLSDVIAGAIFGSMVGFSIVALFFKFFGV